MVYKMQPGLSVLG